MARLRYVKSTDSSGAPKSGSAIRHRVESLRAIYETEPEIARALLPRPLQPAASPEIFVQFANVAMHFSDERVVEIGAATVGVACVHEGRKGYYVLAMPMEGEFVVIGGREKYGEPKKIASTEFSKDEDGRVNAKVTRHGITFLELDAATGEHRGRVIGGLARGRQAHRLGSDVRRQLRQQAHQLRVTLERDGGTEAVRAAGEAGHGAEVLSDPTIKRHDTGKSAGDDPKGLAAFRHQVRSSRM